MATISNTQAASASQYKQNMRWTIDIITPDAAGVEFYLRQYKPFRLKSLQQSPSSFSSTYARESAFDDDDWKRRILNPIATTIVAMQGEDRHILSSVTLIGPVPVPDDAVLARRQADKLTEPMHWEVNAAYTIPEARRQGIAVAVMAAASQLALERASSQGRDCMLTAPVFEHNQSAKLLYEKCGFVTDNVQQGQIQYLVRHLPRSLTTSLPN